MLNILRVLKRDTLRLIQTPAALIIVLALVVLPSMYTWYNVLGFWDPYGNTGNLQVDIVNLDKGSQSPEIGDLNVGDMVVAELKNNDNLKWNFTDYDTAMSNLSSGKSYGAYIIPESFTEDLLTIMTGDFIRPNIAYYVNEKESPISPRITDAGATAIDREINSTFISVVSNIVVHAIADTATDIQTDLEASKSSANIRINKAVASMNGTVSLLNDLSTLTTQAQGEIATSKSVLDDCKDKLSAASDNLENVADTANHMQTELLLFSGQAMPLVNTSLASISNVATKTNSAIGDLTQAVSLAQGSVNGALSQEQVVLDQNKATIKNLRSTVDSMPDSSEEKEALLHTIDIMEANNVSAQTHLDGLKQFANDIQDTNSKTAAASDALNTSVQSTTLAMGEISNDLFGTTVPALAGSLNEISSFALSLEASLDSQQQLLDESKILLDQVADLLATTSDTLQKTSELLSHTQSDLVSLQSDILALDSSLSLAPLLGDEDIDLDQIAGFIGMPTTVKTEQLYEVSSYGSAMTPLFMNLTFWIGAFMLLIIMKQEVDSEGITKLTNTQRYLSRFLLFAVLVVAQAVVCCTGVLVIGVDVVNIPALYFAAALSSLAYLSIIFALSVTLYHIGKGLCVVLIIVQIPGATGLYPIELTPPFFQAVYPMLPFTYGISAMREAICGFYGTTYFADIGMLAFFFVASLIVGLIVRPLLSNMNMTLASQLKETGLYISEDIETSTGQHRFSDAMRILFGSVAFCENMALRRERFMRWYPNVIRGSVLVSIIVPLILVLVFTFSTPEKVVVLTIWLASLALLMVFLLVVETLRYTFEHQKPFAAMSKDELWELYSAHNRVISSQEEGGRDA